MPIHSNITLIDSLTAIVDELRRQIASLEDMLRGKDSEPDKEKAARQAVPRLQVSASEKQSKPKADTASAVQTEPKPEKKRTNDGKRKRHILLCLYYCARR